MELTPPKHMFCKKYIMYSFIAGGFCRIEKTNARNSSGAVHSGFCRFIQALYLI